MASKKSNGEGSSSGSAVSTPTNKRKISSGSSSDVAMPAPAAVPADEPRADTPIPSPVKNRRLVAKPKSSKPKADAATSVSSTTTTSVSSVASSPSSSKKSASVAAPAPSSDDESTQPVGSDDMQVDSSSSSSSSSGSPPPSKKQKRKADPTQANKTLDTQAQLESPGISANRAPSMGVWLRLSADKKRDWNECIQKPKGPSLPEWQQIPVDDRVPWILYYKLAIREHNLTFEQYPYQSFKEVLTQLEQGLLAEQALMEAALDKKKKKMHLELNTKARNIDRQLGIAVESVATRLGVHKELKAAVPVADSEGETK